MNMKLRNIPFSPPDMTEKEAAEVREAIVISIFMQRFERDSKIQKKEKDISKDVPYTVGRLITTEDQSLKQQDALPGYRILHCKISHL